jgi:thioredoxin reductase
MSTNRAPEPDPVAARVLSSSELADIATFGVERATPGIFAAGDVRHAALKRVAAAVGEGSSAVRSVHERLASSA